MLQTVRAEKVDGKNGVICLVVMFSSCVLKLSKNYIFCNFHIYTSESSHYTLSENDMVYRCLRHRS